MIVPLNCNVVAVLSDAGYADGEDNGFFRKFSNSEIKKYNKRGNKPKATKNWRFHAILISDFTFNLHIDFGKQRGHDFINEHYLLYMEAERIKKI